jgi:hypothetical protein
LTSPWSFDSIDWTSSTSIWNVARPLSSDFRALRR